MRRGKLLRAFYYTALLESEEYSPIRPLVDWLHYNGYAMVTKPAKEFTDSTGRRKVKGNMDIELAVDAMEMAPHVDHIVLFSGDGDFKPLVESRCSARACGCRWSRPSAPSPPMIADELRRQCDNFIELDDLREVIGRPPRGDRAEAAAAAAAVVRRRGRVSRSPSRRATARAARGSSAYRRDNAARHPDWFNGAVPSFGDPQARLLVLGLAPGVAGANRTGRPFTGDFAGELLYATLARFGFANGRFDARPDDGLELADCLVSNAVRCVPPANRPAAGRDRHLPRLPRRAPRRAAAARARWSASAASRTRA